MNCEQALHLLDAFLDGRLSPDEEVKVEAHLQRCTSCAVAESERRDLLALLDGITLDALAPLPEDFTVQVLRRVDAEAERKPTLLWPWLQGKWTARQYWSAGQALAATAAAVAGINLLIAWEAQTGNLFELTTTLQAYWQGALGLLH